MQYVRNVIYDGVPKYYYWRVSILIILWGMINYTAEARVSCLSKRSHALRVINHPISIYTRTIYNIMLHHNKRLRTKLQNYTSILRFGKFYIYAILLALALCIYNKTISLRRKLNARLASSLKCGVKFCQRVESSFAQHHRTQIIISFIS